MYRLHHCPPTPNGDDLYRRSIHRLFLLPKMKEVPRYCLRRPLLLPQMINLPQRCHYHLLQFQKAEDLPQHYLHRLLLFTKVEDPLRDCLHHLTQLPNADEAQYCLHRLLLFHKMDDLPQGLHHHFILRLKEPKPHLPCDCNCFLPLQVYTLYQSHPTIDIPVKPDTGRNLIIFRVGQRCFGEDYGGKF